MLNKILNLPLALLISVVFLLLSCASELGYQIGKRFIKRIFSIKIKDSIDENQTTITNSSLGLLALFLGFTFSSALEHFEKNRTAIINEITAINSLYMLEKNIPDGERDKIVLATQNYAKSRIYETNREINDSYIRMIQIESEKKFDDMSNAIGTYIKRNPNQNLNQNLISALQEISKSEIERTEFLLNGVPNGLFLPVGLFLVFNGIIMGLSLSDGRSRHTLITLTLYFLIALAVGIIIDIDRPLNGYIDTDQASIENLIYKIK